jgi:hypothetical protein
LLEIAQKGDIVLVEQIDRISRLKEWNSPFYIVSLFKSIIHSINVLMDYHNTGVPMVSLRYTLNGLCRPYGVIGAKSLAGFYKNSPITINVIATRVFRVQSTGYLPQASLHTLVKCFKLCVVHESLHPPIMNRIFV